jgi:hypothetical protein
VFKAIARTIVAGWPDIRAETAVKPWPHVADNAEPWEVWLDFMRVRNWGFLVTGRRPCTEYEWDVGVKDGKALNAVRRELKYATGDEFEKIYRRLPDRSLRRLTAEELGGKRSDDLGKYYHWLEDGAIEDVFGCSARFCEDLASRTYEAEASASTFPVEIECAPALVVGRSTDPEFSFRAKENFRRLQPLPPQPGEVAHESHNWLCAIWYSWRKGSKKWSFDNPSDATKALFRSVAESTAVELGHDGGPFAVAYWLGLLQSEGIFYRALPDGGEIYQVCNASAEYCVKLETVAKLAKRNSKLASESRGIEAISHDKSRKQGLTVKSPGITWVKRNAVGLKAYLAKERSQRRRWSWTNLFELKMPKIGSALLQRWHFPLGVCMCHTA